MSERERWIIYPLLFLALGAALRDKLINSTESQRVKCQGLMVYDSTGDVSMVLGAEQFPDVRQHAVRSQLKLDTIEVGTLRVTDSVSFQRIMYEDHQRGVTISIPGQHVMGLLRWLDGFQQSVLQFQETAAQKLRESQQQLAPQKTPPSASQPGTPEASTPPATPDGPANASGDRPEQPPQENAPPAEPIGEPAQERDGE
jgi:hypothetical protein